MCENITFIVSTRTITEHHANLDKMLNTAAHHSEL